MSEAEYSAYLLETKERSKIMDPYRDYVLEQLRKHLRSPAPSSTTICSRISMDSRHRTGPCGTYLNLRDAEGIPAPGKIRQDCEAQELPLGLQGQVDMGQQTMQDAYGKNVRVYIFAMVLSASRYKYTCFQLEPFTAQTFIEAHDQAFRYFGGRPCEIAYDQDRVMVVSENAGDIIFTEAFENYRQYADSRYGCAVGTIRKARAK